jgi:hypothetical protein
MFRCAPSRFFQFFLDSSLFPMVQVPDFVACSSFNLLISLVFNIFPGVTYVDPSKCSGTMAPLIDSLGGNPAQWRRKINCTPRSVLHLIQTLNVCGSVHHARRCHHSYGAWSLIKWRITGAVCSAGIENSFGRSVTARFIVRWVY